MPDCDRTAAAIQAVFDGDRPATDLDADTHPATCPGCRARVADARLLLAALALPVEPVAVPARFADGVLAAVRADRPEPKHRWLLASAGGFALVASLLLAVWVMNPPAEQHVVSEYTRAAPPVRVSAEFAKAGDAIRESSRTVTEPAAAAPKALATLAGALLPPLPEPMGQDIAPAAVSLADLPAAARTGLEPVTGTTQKAFTRLLRDVNVFSARPKS